MPLSSENKAPTVDVDRAGDNTAMKCFPETGTPKDVDTPQCPARPPSSPSSSSDEAVQTTDSTSLLQSSKFVPSSYSRLFAAKDVPSKDLEKASFTAPNVSNIDSSQNANSIPTSKTIASITTTPSSSEPTVPILDQAAKNSGVQRPSFTVIKTTESSGSRLYSANVKPPISVKPVEKAPQVPSEPESLPMLSKKTEDFRDKRFAPAKSSYGTASANQPSFSNNNSSPTTIPISVTKPAISTKPTDKFQQGRINRAGSTPSWNQGKLQNFSEMSLKERKSSDDGPGKGGDATTGSIVERAKLDMASFRDKRMREIYSGIQSERQKSLERATKESKNIVQLWLAQGKTCAWFLNWVSRHHGNY